MRKERSGGFTLVESLVSLAAVGVLATLLLLASVNARRNTVARIGAEQFAGFLRETATLSVNGVKAQGCDLDDLINVPLCSEYTVAPVQGNNRAYSRTATGQGAQTLSRELPGGARFGALDAITFSSTPPTLTVSGSRTVEVTHVSGRPVWRVCARSDGTVEVRSPVDFVCAP